MASNLLSAVQRFRATALFTSPTAYRALLPLTNQFDISSLRHCVSAGEPLPKATSDAWFAATGIRLIDGIGATELIHIFISANGDEIARARPASPCPAIKPAFSMPMGAPLPPGKSAGWL